MKSAQEHTELRAVACEGLVFADLDLWADSEQSESEAGSWPSFGCLHQRSYQDKCAIKEPRRSKVLNYGSKLPRHRDTNQSVSQT